MAEKKLDRAHVGPGFEQVDGKGVAQRMRRDRLADTELVSDVATGHLDSAGRNRLARDITREQLLLRMDRAPVIAAARRAAWARA